MRAIRAQPSRRPPRLFPPACLEAHRPAVGPRRRVLRVHLDRAAPHFVGLVVLSALAQLLREVVERVQVFRSRGRGRRQLPRRRDGDRQQPRQRARQLPAGEAARPARHGVGLSVCTPPVGYLQGSTRARRLKRNFNAACLPLSRRPSRCPFRRAPRCSTLALRVYAIQSCMHSECAHAAFCVVSCNFTRGRHSCECDRSVALAGPS